MTKKETQEAYDSLKSDYDRLQKEKIEIVALDVGEREEFNGLKLKEHSLNKEIEKLEKEKEEIIKLKGQVELLRDMVDSYKNVTGYDY